MLKIADIGVQPFYNKFNFLGMLLLIECSIGHIGTNCLVRCPYNSYGKGCQMTCNCSKQNCDFALGCKTDKPGI